MSDVERYTIETYDDDECLAVVVRGPMPGFREQVKLVRASDYEALAEQRRWAVDALEEIVDDLSVPTKPAPWVAHALQTAQQALAALGSGS